MSELTTEDVEGIGPATAKKLKQADIVTVKDLVVQSPNELAEDCNISKETASNYIQKAYQLLQGDKETQQFVTAKVVLERRKALLRCTTGSNELDNLLSDGQGNTGIETQAVTEFFGEFGSGKSQICHTLCVTAQQEPESKGLGGEVIYIDTEGTFRPERVQQIATARGVDIDKTIVGIKMAKAYNSSHLELIIKKIHKFVQEFNAKLIIIDSIISLHRAEFPGRGNLADRQQRINSLLHKLVRVSEIFNVAIVITNQVSTSPDQFAMMDPTKATGGNVLGHTSTYRIYLRKSGRNRIARMIDSPYHDYSDVKFTINSNGVTDAEEEK